MKKLSKLVIIAICAIIGLAIFASCNPYKQNAILGDNKDAKTLHNGSFIVEHGEYLYFINGQRVAGDIKNNKENVWGKVERGAIYRALKSDIRKVDRIVPLVVYSNAKSAGIYIFGNWIYYTTPSNDVNRYTNEVQTSFLVYKRTSLDGTKTQDLAVFKGLDNIYRVNGNSLLILNDEKKMYLTTFNEDKVLKKEVKIKEDIANLIMPTFKNSEKNDLDNSFVYSHTLKDQNIGMEVKIAKYNENAEIIEDNILISKESNITYELKTYLQEKDEIVLYYLKKTFNGSDYDNNGLFALKSEKNKFDISKATLVVKDAKDIFFPLSYADGVVYQDSGNHLVLANNNKLTKLFEPNFKENIVIVDVKYKAETKKVELIYVISDVLKSVSTDTTAMVICKNKVLTSWLLPKRIDNSIYFIDNDTKQLMMVDCNKENTDAIVVGVKFVEENKEK